MRLNNRLMRAGLLNLALVGIVSADCLDFASIRGYLPKDASGVQGQLILLDAPSRDDVGLYVKKDMKWCFVSIEVASRLCDAVERLPPAETRLQANDQTLMVLENLGYTCQEVEGTADH